MFIEIESFELCQPSNAHTPHAQLNKFLAWKSIAARRCALPPEDPTHVLPISFRNVFSCYFDDSTLWKTIRRIWRRKISNSTYSWMKTFFFCCVILPRIFQISKNLLGFLCCCCCCRPSSPSMSSEDEIQYLFFFFASVSLHIRLDSFFHSTAARLFGLTRGVKCCVKYHFPLSGFS